MSATASAPQPSARARAARAWKGTCIVLTPRTTAREVLVQFEILGQRFCIRDGQLASFGPKITLTQATIGSRYYYELVAELRGEG